MRPPAFGCAPAPRDGDSSLSALVVALLAIVLVGVIDYLSSLHITVFPLYFLPLVLAERHCSKAAASLVALFATLAWVVGMWHDRHAYASVHHWVVNMVVQGSAFFIVAVLVASLREALARESELGRIDLLTGISNSRAFREHAAGVLALCNRNQRPVTLAFLDLDHFKDANDALGHLQGDELLCDVARLIGATLRGSDLVARLGGDEFGILLAETDADEALLTLDKLRRAIESAPSLRAHGVTASIGAATWHRPPADLDTMLRTADALMYRAKTAGRNRLDVAVMD